MHYDNLKQVLNALKNGNVPPPNLLPDALLDMLASIGSLRGRVSRLTRTERVLTAFMHKEPDRVPVYTIIFGAGRRLIGKTYADFSLNARDAAESILAAFELIGGDVIVVSQDLSVEAADFGQPMVYPEDSTAHPDYERPIIKDVDDYSKVKRIDLKNAVRMQTFLEALRMVVKKVGLLDGLVGGFVFGPLGVLNMMRGAEFLFRDCMLYPEKVKAALKPITEVLVEYVEAQCDIGVPVVAIDTLFASWNGLKKELWEEIEAPFAREVSEAIHRKGCSVAVHNCGDGPYFDAQIKAMEPEAISFAQLPDDCSNRKELKEKYGDKVVLVGHVPTQLLITGSPHEVIEECKREIEELGDGGGFILAPGCEYPPNTDLFNAYAMVKAAEIFG